MLGVNEPDVETIVPAEAGDTDQVPPTVPPTCEYTVEAEPAQTSVEPEITVGQHKSTKPPVNSMYKGEINPPLPSTTKKYLFPGINPDKLNC